ncbi:hypothetical protein AVEN_236565-1 [Araneus ventricosus]|uniref:Uncharacterized protein n=1 Tax=Araneus ventricosus TaxID=182803 RepID=A0A4Y2BVB3_ARAVE|nr:hypothetical protein AVEN_236565-1 [Araneus ventricosus]
MGWLLSSKYKDARCTSLQYVQCNKLDNTINYHFVFMKLVSRPCKSTLHQASLLFEPDLPEGTAEAPCHACPPGVSSWWWLRGDCHQLSTYAFFRAVTSLCIQGDSKKRGQTLRVSQAHDKPSESHRNMGAQTPSGGSRWH